MTNTPSEPTGPIESQTEQGSASEKDPVPRAGDTNFVEDLKQGHVGPIPHEKPSDARAEK